MSDWNTMWDSLRGALGAQVPRVLGALLILVVGWFVRRWSRRARARAWPRSS